MSSPREERASLIDDIGLQPTWRSIGEEAALYIRRLIFDGVLRAGDRVPQDEVAATMGITRVPIREALIALERDGWVTNELHRGAFVNRIDEQAIEDHYELYGIVYAFAARWALVRTPGVVDHLTTTADALVTVDEPIGFGALAFEFHRSVIDASRSPRVKLVTRALSALVPGDFFTLVPGALEVERKSIPTIAMAMRRGDADAAASRYQTMTKRLGERVGDVFAARGLFEKALDEGSGRPKRRSTRATRRNSTSP